MRLPRRLLPSQAAHAARVAAAATLIIAVIYVGCVTALDMTVASRLTAQTDARLGDRLAEAAQRPLQPGLDQRRADSDADAAPVFLWLANPASAAERLTPGAPRLPESDRPDAARPARPWHATVRLRRSSFRLAARPARSGWLIAGQSMTADAHTERVLLDSELIAGPVLLIVTFIGLLAVGLRALAPVEQSRRRQLEFTADASHELRTPLSVISAEADVTLSAPRDPAEYRRSLARIQDENSRLRRIVEDLLWLARFDSQPPAPGNEPVDVTPIADACADRFRALAVSRSVDIVSETAAEVPALISAPPEWVDRLAGVLMDNACRHAGLAGRVRISVRSAAGRVILAVEDSGPGIPAHDRARLFDRFHRATVEGSGAGLGLAIADSIVASTGGRWVIGDSPSLGGARMEVSWRSHQPRHLQPAPLRSG